MPHLQQWLGRSLAMPLAVAAIAAVPTAPATATPGSGRAVVVTMGDSYISGTAGRWNGNSTSLTGSYDGTDRACGTDLATCALRDEAKVYIEGTNVDFCERSDVSEVLSAHIPGLAPINLACGGATTPNLLPTSLGGRSWKGEQPQGDALAQVARTSDVRAIVITIGGNDLRLATAVSNCGVGYINATGPCRDAIKPGLDASQGDGLAKVMTAAQGIRSVMRAAGYDDNDYRLIVQSYESPIPRAKEIRYRENGPERERHGCPYYDVDADYIRDVAIPQINATLKTAAHRTGAEFIDLTNFMQGREVCSKSAHAVTPQTPPSAA
ncbi:MAG TPA: GDSL-type esterase/lipase family protein, partial [Baekduia sp.]|nr:GDSL-type esterase/lipase family protein [Baekduia sp.]